MIRYKVFRVILKNMNSKDITIGKNLRKVRIYNGMTQQELADALGTTKAAVSAYEHSKTRPTFAMLIKIAQVLNVSTDYLLSFGDEYLDEVYEVSPIKPKEMDGNDRAWRLSGRFMGIGAQIRELREERGLSRQKLADDLSLSVTSIQKYENDIAAPSYGTLLDMARYFDVSTERLFGIETGRKLDVSSLPEDKALIIRNLVGDLK